MAKILIVEDDSAVLEKVVDWFRFEKYIVDHADNGADGFHLLSLGDYDAALIDWNLPKLTGVDLVKRFREEGGSTPILLLTGRGETNDKITGLDSGADDYLTKPFDMRELSSRVRALLRRQAVRPTGDLLKVADISLNSATHQVFRGDREIHLQPVELAILECLMRNSKTVLSVDQILNKAWSSSGEVTPATLRTYIRDLRKKLDREGEESIISNIHGKGYIIRQDGVS
ncbi:MAG: response regulator transcription factor [Candidatus Obscuribacterales bacterium]|jgi:DNA-binding response OmpR family regulator|nr:response regulator transcription factor [Candidatus Obscuribacterales bacterium]